jgi:hypothetical protein
MSLSLALAKLSKNACLVSGHLNINFLKHSEFLNFPIPLAKPTALDKVSPYNWLDDNFWTEKAYLEWRAPLLVNSNWWLAFNEDPLIPRSALSGETNNNRAGTTFWQLRRTAWLIHRILQFKDNVIER